MKKHTFAFLACLLFIFTACSKNEDLPEIPNPKPKPPTPVKKYYYPPVVTIRTESLTPITSKDDYLNASIVIDERDSSTVIKQKLFDATTEIRGRGNSTWLFMPKKAYKLKLTDKAELLGMPANKHWTLLANYSDKTLMRNSLAFEISRRMGFAYTPRMEYVDLYLNNVFDGNYMLCEHIRVASDRVNIPELKPTSKNITGGYLLEIDERMGEPFWFEAEKSKMIFCIKSPEDIPDNQMEYIRNHVQKVENILYGVDDVNTVKELPKYLDMKSFIDYHLLNELARNVDGNLRLSTFVYKKQDDDKLYFGPVWDYDIAFGNADYDNAQYTSGWQTRYAAWYVQFFSHPEFDKMVKDRWKVLRAGQLSNLDPFIDHTKEKLMKSQEQNFNCWQILDIYVWPNAKVTGSYNGEVAYLKDWLTKRIEWMDGQLK